MKSFFIVASEAEISQMKSLEDMLRHMGRTEPMLSGKISLGAIASLSKVFLRDKAKEPSSTKYSWANGSRFYIVDAELCKKMASAGHEHLLKASVPWSEDETWKDADVNRMDLAGFILDMAALCVQVGSDRSLFILLSNED